MGQQVGRARRAWITPRLMTSNVARSTTSRAVGLLGIVMNLNVTDYRRSHLHIMEVMAGNVTT